jgi:hypothetical protein
MVRAPAFSALLLISGLLGASPMAAQTNDQPAGPQPAVTTQLAERQIICNRRRCRELREGCRIVRAPHPRDTRISCTPAGPARPA